MATKWRAAGGMGCAGAGIDRTVGNCARQISRPVWTDPVWIETGRYYYGEVVKCANTTPTCTNQVLYLRCLQFAINYYTGWRGHSALPGFDHRTTKAVPVAAAAHRLSAGDRRSAHSGWIY